MSPAPSSAAVPTVRGRSRQWKPLLAAASFLPLFLLWRPQRDSHYSPPRTEDMRRKEVVENLVLQLAAHDWLLLAYLLTLLCEVLVTSGPHRRVASLWLTVDLGVLVGTIWLVRPERPTSALRALLYRAGILGALLGSFLQLQWILPAASGHAVDAELHAFDLRVFGVEPAEALERFVHPRTPEWFSFFYYGYFILLALHVLPALFLGKDQRFLTTFGFGVLWLYCVGHVVYTIVPAYGPYAHLAFRRPLEGGMWWPLVKRTVASVDGSARTDVFPSLHTAGPAFLTLYAWRSRRVTPFKYTWLPLAFAASQIIIATMFLRWHYLIDICAGLVLACTGVIAGEAAYWWDEGRVAAGGRVSWPALVLRSKQSASPVAHDIGTT